MITDRLVSGASRQCDLWDVAGASRLLDLHNRGNRDFSEYLWRLLVPRFMEAPASRRSFLSTSIQQWRTSIRYQSNIRKCVMSE